LPRLVGLIKVNPYLLWPLILFSIPILAKQALLIRLLGKNEMSGSGLSLEKSVLEPLLGLALQIKTIVSVVSEANGNIRQSSHINIKIINNFIFII